MQEENPGVVYCPYIPVTVATYVNGVKIWDRRWLPNLWCKIYLWLHPKKRKRIEEWGKITVPSKHFTIQNELNEEEANGK